MNFRYDIDKNNFLQETRGIGFEEIISSIVNGNLIEVKPHHNLKKYPNQRVMYVRCLDMVYLVSYVIEEDGFLFLKTLFPSRKAKKFYLDNSIDT
jgi:hypothetical protein